MDNKTKAFIAFFGILLFIAFLNMYQYRVEGEALKKNFKLTYGSITYFGGSNSRSASPPEFRFQANGSYITSAFSKSSFCDGIGHLEEYKIKSQKIPVVYAPDDPSISRILLKKKDYEAYGVAYPDSLGHFLAKYFECK